jgi:hypothetical protein
MSANENNIHRHYESNGFLNWKLQGFCKQKRKLSNNKSEETKDGWMDLQRDFQQPVFK